MTDPDVVLEPVSRGDPLGAARLVLQQLIQRRLDRLVTFRVDGELSLHVTPRNLLGAAWLQLAEAADGRFGVPPRRCVACRGWFLPSPQGRKEDRYCSGACSQKTHRLREKARALRAEGRGVVAIARQLGSDARTVRGWLGRSAI